MRTSIAIVAAIASISALTGCSAGGSGGSSAGGSGGTSGGCSTDLTAGFPDGSEVSLTQAGASTFGDQVLYATVGMDFEMDPETDLRFEYPTVPADGHMAILNTVVWNSVSDHDPLTAGTVLEWTRESDTPTFTVVLQAGEEQFGISTGAGGSVEVTEVSDSRICLVVDYQDDEKSLSGTLAADVAS